jgi:NAD(P)-dependent dehydrogenase (short-subunit alcohol dehydrogenase family)
VAPGGAVISQKQAREQRDTPNQAENFHIMSTAVVVGASRGLGLEWVKQLKSTYTNVIGTTRSGNCDALDAVHTLKLNVSSPEGIAGLKAALDKLGVKKIDLLVNNAGVLSVEDLNSKNLASGMLQQFQTNSMGPILVIQEVLPLLGEGSKIVNVTSRMGSIEDNDSGSYYGYRMSKAALNAATKSVALDLKPKGITAIVIHPGFIRTEMTGNRGDMNADEAVSRMMSVVKGIRIENTGTFYHRDGQTLPW